MIKKSRVKLTKSFLASRLEASLTKNSDIIRDGDGNEFKYLKQQDYFRVVKDLESSIQEYMSCDFWNKESIE